MPILSGLCLSISPHKDSKVIIRTGESLAARIGIDFYRTDLKKKGGFKKAMDLSRKYSFYRQSYCGCKYSIRSNTV